LIHLAAETGITNSNESPQKYLEQNVKSTLNILEYCRKNQINQLLYASSSSVYEPSNQALSENAPSNNQLSFYGKTKKVCEELVDFYCKTHNIKAIGLRFFTVFGSWTRPDMAAYKFMTAIEKGNPIILYNNGEVYRDFTHVSEVINAIGALLKKWDQIEAGKHEIFNVGKGKPISVQTYAETIARCMQKELTYISKELPSNELVHTHCDNSKLKNFVKHREGLNFKEGIEEMVNWFKSHPYGK
jgi:UDP-glucuronate 4-epimerase